MAFPQFLQNGLGTFGQQLFPIDPGMSVPGGANTSPAGTAPPLVDPAAAQAIQRQAMLQFSLGLMAARDDRQGLGHGLQSAFQSAQGGAQQAMDTAFKHTLLKRQADYEQQDRDRQAKTQERQDRQSAAVTAQRVVAGMQSPAYAQNPGAYLSAVQNDPAFRDMLRASGVSLPQPQQVAQNGAITQQPVTPEQYQQFAQQLGQFGQLDAAPTTARDLNLKAVMGPNGKPILVPETQAIGATPYEKPTEAPAEIQGYNFARSQGYKGTFEDWKKASGAKAGSGFDDPKVQDLQAAISAAGFSLPAGFRSKEQQLSLMKGLLRKYDGLAPDDIAHLLSSNAIDYKSVTKATQTAASIVGKVEVANNELQAFVPIARDASALVDRGSFVPWNKLKQMGESNISDPDLKRLYVATQSILNAYDMLAARGGTDQAKREHNRAILSTADSPEAFNAALDMIVTEGQAAGQAARASTKASAYENHPAPVTDDAALLKKWGG